MRRPSSHCQCPVFASNLRPIGGCPPGGRVPQKMTRMAQRPPQRGVHSSPLQIQCRARCAVDVTGHGCESARVQQIPQHQNVRRCQHWVMVFGKSRSAADGRSARSSKVSSSRARPAATGRRRVYGSRSRVAGSDHRADPGTPRCPLLAAPALEERRQRHLAAVLVLVRWCGGCSP